MFQSSSPILQKKYPGCFEAFRLALLRRDTPEPDLNSRLEIQNKNTLSKLIGSYKLWWHFCKDNNQNVYKYSSHAILKFIQQQNNKGSAYKKLNDHHKAFSLLFGDVVFAETQIKNLLESARAREDKDKAKIKTWDPKIVLDHIASLGCNEKLSLSKITMKLVTLLTLCTDLPVKTLSRLKRCNITNCANGIKILEIRDQPMLLPYYKQNKDICPATTLEHYKTITADMKSEYLLLTILSPHERASDKCIRYWVRQTLEKSGVDHPSKSLDIILKAACWTETSEEFAKLYHRPIIG